MLLFFLAHGPRGRENIRKYKPFGGARDQCAKKKVASPPEDGTSALHGQGASNHGQGANKANKTKNRFKPQRFHCVCRVKLFVYVVCA